MFNLENIISYANSNIQIIGIFIAIIGGLVATKLINAKIEKDTLIEKLNKINKEIEFNIHEKDIKKDKMYLKKREDYINYIHDKILNKDFYINDYDDYNLSEEQRLKIIEEIKEYFQKALKIFQKEHKKNEVSTILKENHIQENTIEYTLSEYIGYRTGKSSNSTGPYGITIPDVSDIRIKSPITNIQDEMNERELTNHINNLDSLLRWKIIEKEDIDSKINAINKTLEVKLDIIIFIFITVIGIIIPQIVIMIHPLFKNFKFLKYVFAIYSLLSFICSMFGMLIYILRLYKNIKATKK